MLADRPEPQPEPTFDFSVLNSRIEEVKNATSSISEREFATRDMAKHFMQNRLLPIINTPQIYTMLQNPNFVAELTKVFGQLIDGIYILGKTASRNPEIDG